VSKLRPIDLAREHSITPQAVRNYETDGLIPPAQRSASGYRVYTDLHAAALRAFLALVPAHGHATAREIMRSETGSKLDERCVRALFAVLDRAEAEAAAHAPNRPSPRPSERPLPTFLAS
jgi:DNA-binding transcriptional MerR regulator